MTYKVTTAVTVEPVTLAEARLQCKLTADDSTSEDTLITAWITAMREVAEHYTGRALAPQTLTMALDEFPEYENDVIALDMPPVASITSIKYTDTAGMEQTISASAYSLSTYGDSRRVAPTYGNYWPTTQDIPDAVRILYVTGYGAPSAGAGFAACPKAAKQAILLMVAWLHANRGDSIQPDDIQPPAAKSLLNTIKAWGF
jgi:uncharacterized phiE125 gp8 family phage protein